MSDWLKNLHEVDRGIQAAATGDVLQFDGTRWNLADGLTGTKTFYAASTSGGTVDVLNTVTIVGGLITAWTQVVSGGGVAGEWQFNDAVNSGQVLTIGF